MLKVRVIKNVVSCALQHLLYYIIDYLLIAHVDIFIIPDTILVFYDVPCKNIGTFLTYEYFGLELSLQILYTCFISLVLSLVIKVQM